MELISIYTDGYRNVTDTTIDLSNITSILSTNNYGKSNLLFSIIFGISFLQQHTKAQFNMMNDVKCFPMLKTHENKPFTFHILGKAKIEGNVFLVKYGYSFLWGDPNKKFKGRILSETLSISDNGKDFTTYIKRDEYSCLYKSSSTGRCSSTIQVDNNSLAINKLVSFDNLYYNNILKEILNVNVYIDRHFDTISEYGITFMSEQDLTDLTFKPEINIPKTLYRMKQEFPNKFALLVNTYKSLFPSVENLIVDEITSKITNTKIHNNEEGSPTFRDKIYLLYVKDKNLKYAVHFDAMSDGAKRILLLLTFVVLAQLNNYSLICIEEPENSINPGLLRSFLYSIKELAEDTKILYSSHSPYLINYMEPNNVYLGIPTNNGEAKFRKIKGNPNNLKKLMRILQDNDMALGDYLFDLMSGSNDDCEELISYVE